MEGINQGNPVEALDKYIGDRYTQHSAGVADGKKGFLDFFVPFLERNPVRDIKIVRAIEDGPYVFVHAHQNLNDGEYFYVTGDIFDTDANDRIIEHWDVIQEEVKETKSGRSMVDGPSEIEDEELTEDNRKLIQAFFDEVLIGGKSDILSQFISEEHYAQHHPEIADGLPGLIQYFKELATKQVEIRFIKLHKLLVQGNFAVALSEVKVNEEDWCYIDVYRISKGKITEHWDVREKIGPKETWKNSGKF